MRGKKYSVLRKTPLVYIGRPKKMTSTEDSESVNMLKFGVFYGKSDYIITALYNLNTQNELLFKVLSDIIFSYAPYVNWLQHISFMQPQLIPLQKWCNCFTNLAVIPKTQLTVWMYHLILNYLTFGNIEPFQKFTESIYFQRSLGLVNLHFNRRQKDITFLLPPPYLSLYNSTCNPLVLIAYALYCCDPNTYGRMSSLGSYYSSINETNLPVSLPSDKDWINFESRLDHDLTFFYDAQKCFTRLSIEELTEIITKRYKKQTIKSHPQYLDARYKIFGQLIRTEYKSYATNYLAEDLEGNQICLTGPYTIFALKGIQRMTNFKNAIGMDPFVDIVQLGPECENFSHFPNILGNEFTPQVVEKVCQFNAKCYHVNNYSICHWQPTEENMEKFGLKFYLVIAFRKIVGTKVSCNKNIWCCEDRVWPSNDGSWLINRHLIYRTKPTYILFYQKGLLLYFDQIREELQRWRLAIMDSEQLNHKEKSFSIIELDKLDSNVVNWHFE
jgi:hypothetical protein